MLAPVPSLVHRVFFVCLFLFFCGIGSNSGLCDRVSLFVLVGLDHNPILLSPPPLE
jgi:hypothetical protein